MGEIASQRRTASMSLAYEWHDVSGARTGVSKGTLSPLRPLRCTVPQYGAHNVRSKFLEEPSLAGSAKDPILQARKTRPAGRLDCSRCAMAGLGDAAHGYAKSMCQLLP